MDDTAEVVRFPALLAGEWSLLRHPRDGADTTEDTPRQAFPERPWRRQSVHADIATVPEPQSLVDSQARLCRV